jgi:hypothetical protein
MPPYRLDDVEASVHVVVAPLGLNFVEELDPRHAEVRHLQHQGRRIKPLT